jgi:deoxyribose-phosphate aldolase
VNPGTSFDPRSLDALCIDEPAIAHAVAQVEARAEDRSLREGRLLSAVRCLDLTSLTGRETEADVRSLCASARRPLAGWRDLHAAAICVFPSLAAVAARALSTTPVAVAAVAGGFPAGLAPIGRRVDDVRSAVDAGAGEIDLVIDRSLAMAGRWEELYGELCALRAACGAALMKVILAAGDLGSLRRVARAGHDGRRGFRENIYRKRAGERHSAGGHGPGADCPVVRGRNGDQHRAEGGGRHRNRA